MQLFTERSTLYPALTRNIEYCIRELGRIPEARKLSLAELSRFVERKVKAGEKAQLVFICTHNSRRSHMAQLWAQAAAAYYGIPDVFTYSGGTEATAFNRSAVRAMADVGFQIRPTTEGVNPVYEIRFSEASLAMTVFSKRYDHPENPTQGFAAVMVCSHADQNCPVVQGAESRIVLAYDDPKDFDATSVEAAKYAERAFEIGREILYSFSAIQISRV